jgi:division protein CdvB (Snf7/Vps24/ESCRT-III family)
MESTNTPPDEKPDPDTLISRAKGSIDLQTFTGERSGLFSKAYLSDSSVYERLDDDETIHFLLVSRSNGVTVTSKESNQSQRLSPGGSYRALAAITDRRVFFLIGDDEGDTFLEVDASDVSDVELQSGFLTTTITFETPSKQYELGVKKRESSDPGDAVEYVREQLVPVTDDKGADPSEETPSGQPLSPSTGTNGRQSESTETTASGTSSESGDDSSGDEPQSGPEAVFVRDSEQLSEGTRETARHAAWTIDDVDTSEDAPTDAIPRLETAKEELRRIADEPGIRTAQVEDAIDRLDRMLSELDQGGTDPGERTSTGQPPTSTADADDSQSGSTETTVSETSPENTNDSDADEPQSGPETIFVEDSEQLSEDTREVARHAAWTIDDVDASEDDLADVISRLETAKEELQRIADEPGIRPSQVEDTVDSVDRKLSKLEQITSAYAQAKRQLSLADNGMQIPQETLDDVQSSIDDAVTAANDLDRSTTRLEEYREKISRISTIPPTRTDQTQTGHSSAGTQWERPDGARSSQDESADSPPGSESETTGDSSASSMSDPTREDILAELERVSEELGKRPSTSDFSEHSSYDDSDVYRFFESWGDAVDEASVETLSRQTLLDDLRRVREECGFVPIRTQIDKYGEFSAHDYRREFGGIASAREEAEMDLQRQVIDYVQQTKDTTDGRPSMSHFESIAPYSSGIIYKFFDSWDDALAAARSEEPAPEPEPTGEPSAVERNELSERYEVFRNLRTLCQAVVNVRDEASERATGRPSDPMEKWVDALEKRWSGESIEVDNYGAQQRDRNPFSMDEYRQKFGNGDRVTDFNCASARPPIPTIQTLLDTFVVADIDTFYLPVDGETDATFPVVVETEDELERAIGMLERLPTEPSAAGKDQRGGDGDDGEGDPDPKPPSDALLDVNGVTEKVATALRQGGFESRADLRNASPGELAALDDVSDQIAMRIKLDVGE